jgi:hypothetical protein
VPRPSKGEDAKTRTIKIRVTEAEWQRLAERAQAERLTVTSLVRDRALSETVEDERAEGGDAAKSLTRDA